MDLLRQLQGMLDQFGTFARQIEPLLGLVAVVAGGAACFAGMRIAKGLLAGAGFLFGAAIAAILTLLITSGRTDVVLIPALIGGAIVAALSLAVYYAGLFLAGALAGATTAAALGALADAGANTIVVVVLAVLGGSAFIFAEKPALLLATAAGGAWALVSGISKLSGGNWLDLIGFIREPSTHEVSTVVLFVCWPVVGIVGAIVQSGRLPGRALPMPAEHLRIVLTAGGAVVTAMALCAIFASARAFPPPAIPAPIRTSVFAGTARPTPATVRPDATASAIAGTATSIATAASGATGTPPAATRAPSPSPTRDPASYAFRAEGAPTAERSRACIGGYYIFGVVRDRLGQPMVGVRIKYGTPTIFPPVALTEAKGYELTVGSTDSDWYVRVVDTNEEELSEVVIIRTTGLANGSCWYRLDWRQK